MNTIQFIQTSTEELTSAISKAVEVQLMQLKEQLLSKDANDELLTRKEACKLLQIDQSTLWHWTNKGKVKAYGIANRRYYKRSELNEALKPLNK
ncbi:helix-turn-helix domain-containing protein [Flavobacteriaceae bacterium]|jgi:excisionase family DNA binding protein|nr:helix-turn-helix domain-containing protein [Flavobacteriaceae bacterium]|tara:strand:- start:240 stop:521 length:282 start_codon:yes stop_codon:yes gene_type:complete